MRNKAEVTLEAAIVVPAIILLIISIIYLSFIVHDLVVLKSCAYSIAVENAEQDLALFSSKVKEKMSNAPTLVMKATTKCYVEGQQYVISMTGATDIKINIIEKIIQGMSVKVKVQKNMDIEQIQFVNGILSVAEGE